MPPHKLIFLLEKRLFKAPEFLKLVVISKALQHLYYELYGPIKIIEAHHDAADEDNLDVNFNCSWPSNSKPYKLVTLDIYIKEGGLISLWNAQGNARNMIFIL